MLVHRGTVVCYTYVCMCVHMYVRVKYNGLRSLLVQSGFSGLTLISRFKSRRVGYPVS